MPKLDFTKPITTRDGRDVRILCKDGPNLIYPVIVIIEGDTTPTACTLNGNCGYTDHQNTGDIINKPEGEEGYYLVKLRGINIPKLRFYYKTGDRWYSTREMDRTLMYGFFDKDYTSKLSISDDVANFYLTE